MNYFKSLLFFCTATLFAVTSANAQSSTVGIVSELYANGHPTNNRQGDIYGIATYNNFLYISWRYLSDPEGNLNDEIHRWDISNVYTPQLEQISDFPALLNGFQETLNTPRSLQVIKGHLLLWSANKLFVFYINQDGSLTEVLRNGFEDALNQDGTGVLKFGGNYASTQRTMLTNNEFLQTGDEDRLQDYALLNLQDPTKPYFETLNRNIGQDLLFNENEINGSFQGLPATIELSQDQLNVVLTTYTHRRSQHFDKFWEAPLRNLLQKKNFGRTLGAISNQIVASLKPSRLSTVLFNQFIRDLRLGRDYGFQTLLSANYTDDQLLSTVLSDLGIKTSDSIDLALQKVIEKAIRTEFSGQIEKLLGNQVLNGYQSALFGTRAQSVRAVKRHLNSTFNKAISKQGLDNYLVTSVLSPLIGNPPLLRLKLKDLIRQFSASQFGIVVDAGLNLFHTLFPIDAIRNGLPFDTPRCFAIPRSSSTLLKKLLVDTGPELNLRGLAFFEMLKLADFYSGNENYKKLSSALRANIQELHNSLSTEFMETLLAPIDQYATDASKLSAVFSGFSGKIQFEKALSIPLARALSVSLSAAGISSTATVGATLRGFGLYTSIFELPAGASLATIANLRQKISDLGLDAIRLETVFRSAGATGSEEISSILKSVSSQLTSDIFGNMSDDKTMKQALERLVTGKISGKVYANVVQSSIGTILTTVDQDIPLPGIFGAARLASKGDCLAQWQLALLAAEAAASGSVVFAEFAPLLAGANENLTIAYEQSLQYVLRTLLEQFLAEIFTESTQNYESWYSRPTPRDLSISLAQVLPVSARYVTPFVVRGTVALVATDVEEFGFLAQNPTVNLVLFNPDNIAGTRQVVSLGDWYSVANVILQGDYLLVQGQKVIDDIPTEVSLIMNISHGLNSPQYITGEAAENISSANHLTVLKGGQLLAASNLAGRVSIFQTGL